MFNAAPYRTAKKAFLFSLLTLFSIARAFASVPHPPTIASFSPVSGNVGTAVTINGTNFDATQANNIVFFGATMATVTSATTTTLSVTVPAGATYAPITVLEVSGHLSGTSKNQFIPTFTGTRGISTSSFGSAQTFATGSGPLFVTIADIDGDGKPDIVVIDQGANDVGVYLNKSSGGTITTSSFAAEQTFSVGSGAAPSSIAIGDIDGDGKLDVVTSNISNGTVSVLRNTSSSGSISFATHADFSCGSNTDPNFVAVADFDGDGKPDIAVTDEATSKVSVFLNTTTSGSTTITFAAHADFGLASEPGGIAVGDFDGDGKVDIAATIGSTTNISVLHNTSSGTGNINFGSFVNFTVGNSPIALTTSDVDGDGKPDLVVANAGDGTVSVLRNNSSSGTISFVAHQDITVDDPNIDPNESFYYIQMNDLDGDGKPDMVVVDNDNALYLLKNNSGVGSPSFGSVVKTPVGTASFALYGVAIGDLNSDGKPDMVGLANGDSKIDVLQNNTVVPVLSPTTTTISSSLNPSFTVSPNNTVTFTATVTHSGSPVTEGTVSFTSNGAAISGGTNVAVNGSGQAIVNTSYSSTGSYTIVATYNGDSNYSSSTSTSLTQNVDLHPTTISSLTKTTSSSFTNASQVTYTATFASAISGLTTSNFSLSGTASGASIASVSPSTGSSTSFTVTVNTGSTDGTLILSLANQTGLSPGVSNTSFAGDTYTVDKTKPTASISAPSVTYANSSASIVYTVTFSDANLNSSSISLTPATLMGNIVTAGSASIHPNVTSTPASSNTYTVTFSNISGDGTFAFTVPAGSASDNAGNSSSASSLSTAVTIDNTAPTIQIVGPSKTITNTASVSYSVAYNDANYNTNTLSTGNVTLVKTGTANGSLSFIGTETSSPTVIISGITGDGTLGISVAAGSASDKAGNLTSAAGPSTTFTVDNTAPAVNIGAPSVSSTTSVPVSYSLTFSDTNFSGSTLSLGDLSLNKTGTATGTLSLSGSGTSYTVTISSISGAGTLGFSIPSGKATDQAGNSSASASSTTFNVVLPTTTVTEVLRDSSNPTQGGTVSYLVEFADAITGLSAADFSLSSTGSISGASIGTISGSGTAYTVNVSTGTGEGTVTLNFTSSSGLDHTVTNAPFNGQAFTIDKTPPVVTSVALPPNGTYGVGGALQFVVSFNEPVTVNTAGGTPYIGVTLNTGGTVQATYVSGSTSQQLTFTYTVVSGNADPDGIAVDNAITFNGATFSDFAGNLASSETLTGLGSTSGILVDAVPPVVNSITLADSNPTNATTVDYTVTFSEPVSGVGTGAFSLTTTSGNAAGNINSVTAVSSSVYTVNINNVSGNGAFRLDLTNVSGIFDLSSNQLATGFTGSVYTIDNTPATLTSGSYFSNNGFSSQYAKVGDQVTLSVGYNEQLQSATMTIGGNTVPVSFSNGNQNFTGVYTMTPSDTEGNVPWTLSATDLAGNVRNYTNNDFGTVLIFDKTPPLATISAPSAATVTNNGTATVTYTISYSDANFNFSSLSNSDITLNATGTAAGTVALSGSGTSYTVTISNITGLGTLGISIGANTAQDIPGNLALAAGPSTTFNVFNNDDALSGLTLSNGSLTPGFTSTTTSYTAAVGYGLASINITPATHDPNATVTINGNPATSGSANAVPLIVGTNNVSIVVTAQDGTTQQTYTVTITEAQSYNNNLASVRTSAGLAQGSTVPSTMNENVVNSVSSLTVTPTVADPTATVTVNGVTVTSGQPSASIPLSVGKNGITIVVTAQDTRTQSYTLTVTRAPSANDKLFNLVVSSGTLSPAFGTATNYLDYVANGVPFSITPTLADPTATLTINGTSAPSGTATSVPLIVGNNTVTIVVTAQDNSSTKTYTVIVNEARSPNSTLYSLTTSAGFSQGQTVPTTLAESVPNATSTITVTPTMADNTATVTVNGATVLSGQPSANMNLNVGANTITIVGTAQNGNTTTYTLTVTRAASSLLTNIAATAGSLSPAFASTTTSYAIYAVAGTTSTTITPTAADPNAIIKVNGSTVNSGSPSQPITTPAGNTIVTIAVTAADNSTTTTYTVGVNVARSPNNTLLSFATSGGLSQGQTVPTTLTESVPNATSSITVTPTTVDANATVTVNNVAVTSGNASGPITLNVGANTITTVVTAQNGTPLTYTLTVTRAASANLSNLTLSSGTLNPAFAPGTTAYSTAVGNGVASITVKPTASDPNAVIKVNGSTVASGSSSSSIPLTVGNNNITVTVTAADNSSTITYNVGVNRARSSNDALFSFKTSAGLAKGVPVPTTLTESVVNATSTITITPTAQDATATITVDGTPVTSGGTSAAIALSVGGNTITTVVTAQSGVTQTYTLTITRAMGSVNTVYQPIGVTKPDGDVQLSDDGITVHQGLSPNGDGINDYLQIDNISQYPDNNLKIMNRNGQLVYEAKGYDNAAKAFDGHSNKNGQMQLPGTYFYSLDYTIDGVTKHKTGYLVLKY